MTGHWLNPFTGVKTERTDPATLTTGVAYTHINRVISRQHQSAGPPPENITRTFTNQTPTNHLHSNEHQQRERVLLRANHIRATVAATAMAGFVLITACSSSTAQQSASGSPTLKSTYSASATSAPASPTSIAYSGAAQSSSTTASSSGVAQLLPPDVKIPSPAYLNGIAILETHGMLIALSQQPSVDSTTPDGSVLRGYDSSGKLVWISGASEADITPIIGQLVYSDSGAITTRSGITSFPGSSVFVSGDTVYLISAKYTKPSGLDKGTYGYYSLAYDLTASNLPPKEVKYQISNTTEDHRNWIAGNQDSTMLYGETGVRSLNLTTGVDKTTDLSLPPQDIGPSNYIVGVSPNGTPVTAIPAGSGTACYYVCKSISVGKIRALGAAFVKGKYLLVDHYNLDTGKPTGSEIFDLSTGNSVATGLNTIVVPSYSNIAIPWGISANGKYGFYNDSVFTLGGKTKSFAETGSTAAVHFGSVSNAGIARGTVSTGTAGTVNIITGQFAETTAAAPVTGAATPDEDNQRTVQEFPHFAVTLLNQGSPVISYDGHSLTQYTTYPSITSLPAITTSDKVNIKNPVQVAASFVYLLLNNHEGDSITDNSGKRASRLTTSAISRQVEDFGQMLGNNGTDVKTTITSAKVNSIVPNTTTTTLIVLVGWTINSGGKTNNTTSPIQVTLDNNLTNWEVSKTALGSAG